MLSIIMRRAVRHPASLQRRGLATVDGSTGTCVSAVLRSPFPAQSMAFYGKLFQSWSFVPSHGGYTVSSGGRIVAHILPGPLDPVVWAPAFIVHSAKDSARVVIDNGGTVIATPGLPSSFEPHGHVLCCDPQGGPFYLRQRTEKEMSAEPRYTTHPPAGHLNWLDVLGDPDGGEQKLATFYARVLGWDTDVALPFPGGKYVIGFEGHGRGRTNGNKVCGLLPRATLLKSQLQACCLPFFSVPDSKSVAIDHDVAVRMGGSSVFPPTSIKDGEFAIVRDPHSAPLALYYRTDVWDEVREYV